MTWTYGEMLQGNTHQSWIMDSIRVVCTNTEYGIDVQNPPESVERRRREFKRIIELWDDSERGIIRGRGLETFLERFE